MASVRGILNIQSLNELTYEKHNEWLKKEVKKAEKSERSYENECA